MRVRGVVLFAYYAVVSLKKKKSGMANSAAPDQITNAFMTFRGKAFLETTIRRIRHYFCLDTVIWLVPVFSYNSNNSE